MMRIEPQKAEKGQTVRLALFLFDIVHRGRQA